MQIREYYSVLVVQQIFGRDYIFVMFNVQSKCVKWNIVSVDSAFTVKLTKSMKWLSMLSFIYDIEILLNV